MIRNTSLAAVAAVLGSTALTGQDAASTLVRLVETSPSIVQARVLQTRTVGDRRQVTFKIQQALRGTHRGSFALTEPAGRACGRALFAVLTGSSYLLFLAGDGPTPRLSVGSARAVVHVDPAVLGHVTALLQAPDAAERSRLLAANLTAPHPRIRRDAALALPIRPGLERLDAAGRDRILFALEAALGHDQQVAFGLIRTASRLRLHGAAPLLLESYLDHRAAPLSAVLRTAILTLDAPRAVQQLQRAFPVHPAAQARALHLLEDCGSRPARAFLEELAHSPQPRLAAMVRATLDRTRAATPHRFKAIRTGRPSFRR